jgi:hypothetical protein
MSGRIDLLIEFEDALIIIDHKDFPRALRTNGALWRRRMERSSACTPMLLPISRADRLARCCCTCLSPLAPFDSASIGEVVGLQTSGPWRSGARDNAAQADGGVAHR